MNTFLILKFGKAPENALDRRDWLKTLPHDFLFDYGYADAANYYTQPSQPTPYLYIKANGTPERIYRDLEDYCNKAWTTLT